MRKIKTKLQAKTMSEKYQSVIDRHEKLASTVNQQATVS